jgi:hypothetical protein
MDSHRQSNASEVPVEKGGAQHLEDTQYGSQDTIEHLDVNEKKLLRKMYVGKLVCFSWRSGQVELLSARSSDRARRGKADHQGSPHRAVALAPLPAFVLGPYQHW